MRLDPPCIYSHLEIRVFEHVFVQCLFIDDRPPRGVDEDCVRFHFFQFPFSDEPFRMPRQRDGNNDYIRFRQDLFEVSRSPDKINVFVGRPAGVYGHYFHPESLHEPCGSLADSAESDNARSFPLKPGVVNITVEFALGQFFVTFQKIFSESEHHSDDMFSHWFGPCSCVGANHHRTG